MSDNTDSADSIDRAPDPPSDDAEDVLVPRDETGEIQGVTYQTDAAGQVVVKPMAYGAIERHFGADAGQVTNVQSDQIADVLAEQVVSVAGGAPLSALAERRGYEAVDGEFVREEMKPLVPRDLLMAILDVSGVDADVMVDQAGNATVEVAEQGNPS